MFVNLTRDLPMIRDYFADRVRAQAPVSEPVSAIEVGFRLDQACLIVLNFDPREQHARDGTWTAALDGPALELPHWSEAFASACDDGISFVLLNGESRELTAQWLSSEAVDGDGAVAGVFGEALLAIALDAIASGLFDPLPLRDECQLDLEEFDGMWAWPSEHEDIGRANIIRGLKAVRLPRHPRSPWGIGHNASAAQQSAARDAPRSSSRP